MEAVWFSFNKQTHIVLTTEDRIHLWIFFTSNTNVVINLHASVNLDRPEFLVWLVWFGFMAYQPL